PALSQAEDAVSALSTAHPSDRLDKAFALACVMLYHISQTTSKGENLAAARLATAPHTVPV
ncbi:MAG: hypothetical protein M1140_02815, partial [Chloroflexi bacterium]|nr:hypothetical protein [Chloroflexota bacterium]